MLDAELVAVDRDNNNRLKAFQELSTRARGAITTAEVQLDLRHSQSALWPGYLLAGCSDVMHSTVLPSPTESVAASP